MRRSPSPSAEVDTSERCLNDSTGHVDADGIPEVSGNIEHLPSVPEQNPHMQNGPLGEVPPTHCKFLIHR